MTSGGFIFEQSADSKDGYGVIGEAFHELAKTTPLVETVRSDLGPGLHQADLVHAVPAIDTHLAELHGFILR
jgi:hypothetical protein